MHLMRYMFLNCTSLKYINFNNFKTTNVLNMSGMFGNCNSLTSLDLSGFDTNKTILLNSMFYGCHSLTSLNLTNFNLSSNENFNSMFFDCYRLKNLYLPSMSTTNAINFSYMFFNCYSLKFLDLSVWNISCSETIIFYAMFYNCTSLTSLNISNFDTSSVQHMGIFDSMFEGCKNLRYLNIFKLQDIIIPFYYRNILKKTPENMVICLPETKTYDLKTIFLNKTCGVITCDENWKKQQKKINNETGECMDKCEGSFGYEYNTQCYRRCPKGTIFNETSNLCEECNFKDCNINKLTNEQKEEFVEDIINKIKDGSLDTVLSSVVDSGENLVIKNEEEAYTISTTTDMIIVGIIAATHTKIRILIFNLANALDRKFITPTYSLQKHT